MNSNAMNELRGVIPAIVTPFNESRGVDHATLEELTSQLIAGGVEASLANGQLAIRVLRGTCASAVTVQPTVAS